MVYLVVQQPNGKEQLRAWSQVVKIGKNLLELQNFNSLLAIYLALQNPQVTTVRFVQT